VNPQTRPRNLTLDRAAGRFRIDWGDGHTSDYPLAWLRAHCPCATCREERRAVAASGGLMLHSGTLPSTEIVGAELVGAYAVRLDWSDGHNTGIYPFSALRQSCPCPACNPDGPPPLLPD
jgi:DUF971 family protein